MTVTPAYGRDYKSAKAAKGDWDAGKDFIIADMFDPYDGKPINKEQADARVIYIRFNQLRSITEKYCCPPIVYCHGRQPPLCWRSLQVYPPPVPAR